ncbi:MAG: amino acid ABC transporter ATP-binding protein [Kordiimonadaceae bacterium]|jgi:ABC-type polar amino acid transport system ATPase subunit|nr:amino acid ABC transporter ATP-binding protein [Kordiimonadaceae bacterium]MBT6037321.1 amino acid ABC transporter ATP-binding protein [Kordiimonadaceae bacterium]MBT6329269.1 amino acid ABC transporter ATP-binding protein [Kordiimonadaceae bacterium]MBT7581752.1 amino acid ABC transporter ATP-binding protein [Kordiimonadaceae bacterium]
MSSNAAVKITDLHKSFGELEVLKGIDMSVAAGEVICILGASGSGKSTLLRCINQLTVQESGEIYIHGDAIGASKKVNQATLAKQRSRIGYVFQQFNLWPHRTALGNVADALMVVKKIPKKEAGKIALDRLTEVGLADWQDEYPSTLSGGQQQRVAIARMLAMEPEVMLFDEPTSALDPERVGEVIDVMRALAAKGHTMIIATHELNFARDTADRVIFIDQGVIVEQGVAKEFFESPKSERLRSFLKRMSG